jgi:hypothetical protein
MVPKILSPQSPPSEPPAKLLPQLVSYCSIAALPLEHDRAVEDALLSLPAQTPIPSEERLIAPTFPTSVLSLLLLLLLLLLALNLIFRHFDATIDWKLDPEPDTKEKVSELFNIWSLDRAGACVAPATIRETGEEKGEVSASELEHNWMDGATETPRTSDSKDGNDGKGTLLTDENGKIGDETVWSQGEGSNGEWIVSGATTSLSPLILISERYPIDLTELGDSRFKTEHSAAISAQEKEKCFFAETGIKVANAAAAAAMASGSASGHLAGKELLPAQNALPEPPSLALISLLFKLASLFKI